MSFASVCDFLIKRLHALKIKVYANLYHLNLIDYLTAIAVTFPI